MAYALPTPNTDSDIKQKFLRAYYASAIILVPALALAATHGGLSGQPFPAVGLVPLGLGSLFALYRADQFRHKKVHEYQIVLPNEDDDDYTGNRQPLKPSRSTRHAQNYTSSNPSCQANAHAGEWHRPSARVTNRSFP